MSALRSLGSKRIIRRVGSAATACTCSHDELHAPGDLLARRSGRSRHGRPPGWATWPTPLPCPRVTPKGAKALRVRIRSAEPDFAWAYG